MTKEEILLETIQYYSKPNTRAVILGLHDIQSECSYELSDGRRCAVGRCMTDAAIDKLRTNNDLRQPIDRLAVDNADLDTMLQEKYHGHSIDFWTRLQGIHDNRLSWNEKGLSIEGKNKVNKIINDYLLDIPLLN